MANNLPFCIGQCFKKHRIIRMVLIQSNTYILEGGLNTGSGWIVFEKLLPRYTTHTI